MTDRLQKACLYLKEAFNKSEYYKKPENSERKKYRIEHSIRVCKAGLKIAEGEGFDEEHKEAIQIACLLHDIGYSIDRLQEENDMKNHGPEGAKLVQPFLESLGYSGKLLEDMIFGIAIHQSGNTDIEGDRNSFSLTVANADDIDRFGSYKTALSLERSNISKMEHQERLNFIWDKIGYYNWHLENQEYGTETAKKIITEEIALQIKFYQALSDQEYITFWEE